MLLKCPECGGMVSDSAVSCPHCGNTNIAVCVPDKPRSVKSKTMRHSRPIALFAIGVPLTILWLMVSVCVSGLVADMTSTVISLIVFAMFMKCIWDVWQGKLYGAVSFCFFAPLLQLAVPFEVGSVVILGAFDLVLIIGAVLLYRNRAIKEWTTWKRRQCFTFKE